MKKILITGAGSYIGMSFEKWLKNYPDQYQVSTVDMRDESWREKNFGIYDAIFHVAGIAHVDPKKNDKMRDLYFKVNRDLTIETAQKAKADGARQFVFMSSIIVYGDSSQINGNRIITRETKPDPSGYYGESKLQAEDGILPLQSEKFNVVILRPPMVYGKDSKGNYPRLAQLAQKVVVFPDIDNQRSMLHIDNLCEFIRVVIEQNDKGIFFPQNTEYVKTSEMVRMIAEVHGKKIKQTRAFNGLLKFLALKVGMVNKVFGSLVYEKAMSNYKVDYRVRSLAESIRVTEVSDAYE